MWTAYVFTQLYTDTPQENEMQWNGFKRAFVIKVGRRRPVATLKELQIITTQVREYVDKTTVSYTK